MARNRAGRSPGISGPRVYAGQLALPEALARMAGLRALAEVKRVALLCYERDTVECHRVLLVDALPSDFARVDLEPIHP